MDTQAQIKQITEQLLKELSGGESTYPVQPNSDLSKDIGLGSIERSELIHRIEKEFDIRLPDSAITELNTISALANAVDKVQPKTPTKKTKEKKKKRKHAEEEPQLDVSKLKTFNELVQALGKNRSEQVHVRLITSSEQEQIIRFGELYQGSLRVATALQKRHVQPNDTVAIMLPTAKTFFTSFFGVLFAGAIPVPIYPPLRSDEIERYVNRQIRILQNAQVRGLITFGEAQKLSPLVKPYIESLQFTATGEELLQSPPNIQPAQPEPSDIALIQYTSGSTGSPKGVVLTHNNLLNNIRAFGQAGGIQPNDIAVSWLPLYHDMGLIGMWLGSLYYGITLVLMSPLTFLARPERWLWAIRNHHATISGGPNFGYELCLNKIPDEAIKGLDLSSWRIAFNGAEAIHAQTMERFTQRFAPYGFRHNAHLPVYGLAESSVGLTISEVGADPYIDTVARKPLFEENRAEPTENIDEAIRFVGCGQTLPDHEIRIVDSQGAVLSERQVGEIEFKGPSCMQGYYRNTQATQAAYDQGWWRTGDLGYIADNHLFITGRKKDIIIKAGNNIYPEEVESIAAEVEGVRKGCVAAFGSQGIRHQQSEKMIIVAEIKPAWRRQYSDIRQAISQRIGQSIGIVPDEIILAQPHTIPKTSSGKLQRHACKQSYEKGQLGAKKRRKLLQFVKVVSQNLIQRGKQTLSLVGRTLYGIYVGLILLIMLPTMWLMVALVSENTGARITKMGSLMIMLLCFCPVRVYGRENITDQEGVIVCNHASYIDTVALMATLPTNIVFLGKQELVQSPLFNTFIRRLGYVTVAREQPQQSLDQLQSLQDKLKAKKFVVIYPEGTFTAAKGLKPFKLGAFKLAAETSRPIYPMALQNTRTILPAGRLLPTPRFIKLFIGSPIHPKSNDWQAVTELRDKAYQFIAKYCGEME